MVLPDRANHPRYTRHKGGSLIPNFNLFYVNWMVEKRGTKELYVSRCLLEFFFCFKKSHVYQHILKLKSQIATDPKPISDCVKEA